MRRSATYPIVASLALALLFNVASSGAGIPTAQTQAQKPFEPQVGQDGKDVVWVPTPEVLVDKMLDMAKVTPNDVVMDLGSGDGRTVIAAARRGARAVGVEYNTDMVGLSRRNAAAAAVAERATFVNGDLFEIDLTQADVITMFLLPDINLKLRATLLKLRPGTRIVSNSFDMDDWVWDESVTVGDNCVTWCTAFLWLVPANVEGAWQFGQRELKLNQQFQMITGTLSSTSITGRLRGNEIAFSAGNAKYTGRVDGEVMKGTDGTSGWSATRK